MDVTVASIAERPDLDGRLGRSWPAFIFHDPVAKRLIPAVSRAFPHLDLVLVDPAGEVVAGGWGVPVRWDGSVQDLPDGWDGALERAVAGNDAGDVANTLCAMATEVLPDRQGEGLAGAVLTALRRLAAAEGFERMIAPARPTLKHRYPLTPIGEYVSWRRADGTSFDPWLRAHERLGGRMIATTDDAMAIVGSVAEWEEWTGLPLPARGEFVVTGALAPITVDIDADAVAYHEPAVWMLHEVP